MTILTADAANAQPVEASSVKQALRERCLAAIAANVPSAQPSTLRETIGMVSGGGHYLFELKQSYRAYSALI